MSDSNQSWQAFQKVILLTQSEDSTHKVLLQSLILAGVNAAVLPRHMVNALHSFIK